jgi:hypothetical protein
MRNILQMRIIFIYYLCDIHISDTCMCIYIYTHLYVYVYEYVHVYVNEFVYEYVYEYEYV